QALAICLHGPQSLCKRMKKRKKKVERLKIGKNTLILQIQRQARATAATPIIQKARIWQQQKKSPAARNEASTS
ncbi:MAG: hypothetical protein II674_10370, partial [Prevotella sp.]|nr:hypothetical protein [Prevotella sp.]